MRPIQNTIAWRSSLGPALGADRHLRPDLCCNFVVHGDGELGSDPECEYGGEVHAGTVETAGLLEAFHDCEAPQILVQSERD